MMFDLYVALDALEAEVTNFCKGLDVGVFGALTQQEFLRRKISSFSASKSSTKLCLWTTLSVREALEVSWVVHSKRVDTCLD